MVALGQSYKVEDLGELGEYGPIPEGTYKALIVGSEMKENNAKTGQYLELEIDITEGQFQGRKLYERLNLVNPNEVAVSIAQRTLGSICLAVGIKDTIQDSNELHLSLIHI